MRTDKVAAAYQKWAAEMNGSNQRFPNILDRMTGPSAAAVLEKMLLDVTVGRLGYLITVTPNGPLREDLADEMYEVYGVFRSISEAERYVSSWALQTSSAFVLQIIEVSYRVLPTLEYVIAGMVVENKVLNQSILQGISNYLKVFCAEQVVSTVEGRAPAAR